MSTIVIPKTECNRHSAELTSLCTAAAAVTLQEMPWRSVLCEIPWCLRRWLERLVVLPCFYTLLLHILQTASDLIRTSPSLQKPECFHTHSPSPLPSTMLRFVVVLRFSLLPTGADDVTTGRLNWVSFNMSLSVKVLKKHTSNVQFHSIDRIDSLPFQTIFIRYMSPGRPTCRAQIDVVGL